MTINKEENFLNTFIDCLNNKFDYCILRNYEKYPQKIGNDIDILIRSNDINHVAKQIGRFFENINMQYKIKTRTSSFLSIICFYKTVDENIESIQVDIWTKLEWRGIEWIDVNYIIETRLKYNNFYIPCKGCEVAITVFKELVANGIVKEKYYNSLTSKLREDKDKFIISLHNCFGNYVYNISELINNSKYNELNKKQRVIRSKLILKHPFKYTYSSIKKILEKVSNIFNPKGKMVAFIGPDGSGKTTFINLAQEHFEKLYNGVKKYHIKFNILPELKTGRGISSMKGVVNKTSESSTKINRSFISKLASWFVVLYYTLEFFIGRIPLRKYKIKNYIILYDRYYYDFFVQPTSRNLIYKFRKILLLFVKKPDIIIHLDADADSVYSRKQELSMKEIEIQNTILKDLFKGCKNAYSVKNVNKSINDIDQEIFEILYKGL